MRCAAVQRELTALADGALPPASGAKLRQHVDGCAACAHELKAIERTVQLEHQALRMPLPEIGLGFETRLRQRLAEEEQATAERRWWSWLWKPALVGGVTAAIVLLAAAPLGGPSAVLVPLGIKQPPPKVARDPELFKDYAIIERLDELENFDTVETTPLEDELQLPGESKEAG